jgi:hypothetical protein
MRLGLEENQLTIMKLFRKLCITAGLSVTLLTLGQFASNAATVLVGNYLFGSNHWASSNTYVLTNFTYVMSNAVLVIEPGTVVKGRDGTFPNYGALVINRGGKIFADGTRAKPIIFTAEIDNVQDPFDLPISGTGSRGLWGGIVINGRARINCSVRLTDTPLQDIYEGLPDSAHPGGEPLHRFGGDDDDDNSGILRFVSIRHAGKVIEANREINALSMGGVGRGTTIEYVEAYLTADDGFEFFGGNVNTKYCVSAFNDDESFDTDQGYRGKNQFWFTIQAQDRRDEGGEFNGVNQELDAQGTFPFESTFEVYNWTAIGAGAGGGASGNEALVIRHRSQTRIYNSIWTEFDGRCVVFGTNAAPDLKNNLFWRCTGGGGSGYGTTFVPAALNPTNINPMLRSVSRTNFNNLDPRPLPGSPVFNDLAVPPNDGFYTQTDFKGAFGCDNWLRGWTALENNLFLGSQFNQPTTTRLIGGFLTGSNFWSRTNVWVLTNFTYVMSNAVLVIEPGTVVKGRDGTFPNYGALVVNRGAKIFADATACDPIIFTAESDNVNDPFDLPIVGTGSRGLWGGIVINGRAQINCSVRLTDTPLQDIYEGLPDSTGPGGEYLHRFGGGNDDDSSGVLRFVSIRHGGKVIEANREINALSMGGVGRGTVIECVEAYLTADDGFEFFGGNVNTKYCISAFNDDESFDTDQGYRGKNQFWFTIQAQDRRDEGGEFNGVNQELDAQGTFPFESTFEVYNWTAIGAGAGGGASGNEALVIRHRSQTRIYNSIWTEFDGRCVVFGTNAAPDLKNNLFWQCTGGGGSGYNTSFVPMALNPTNVNPLIASTSRTNLALLDPRPALGGPAFSDFATPPSDGFYQQVGYKGAFGSNNWALGWTALDANAFFNWSPYAPPSKGAVVVSCTAVALTISASGGDVTLQFGSTAGLSYQVESTTDIAGAWGNEGADLNGTGGNLSYTTAAGGPQRFFRVRCLGN